MKEKILKISDKLRNNEITEKEAQNQFLFLFGVSNKNYGVITPTQDIISIEEYMMSDDYNNRLEKGISDFMTNKKEKELIELFKKK